MDNLDRYPFMGLTLLSILYNPSIVGRRHMRSRHSHALILKLRGATKYSAGDQHWLLSAGQVLFVKKGSSYYIEEISPGYSYVVNFDGPGQFPNAVSLLPLPADYDLSASAERMYNAWQKENVYHTLALLYTLITKTTAAMEKNYTSSREKQLLDPVMAYLKEHLTDPELKLEELPRLAGISDTYLRRIFKKQYGVSPSGYVTRERVRLAKDFLLRIDNIRITEVAEKVGYHDPLYFSRLFKKQTGLSPTEYCTIHQNTLF